MTDDGGNKNPTQMKMEPTNIFIIYFLYSCIIREVANERGMQYASELKLYGIN